MTGSRFTLADVARLSPDLQRQVELQLYPTANAGPTSRGQDRSSTPRAEPQPAVRHDSVGTSSREAFYPGRVRIRITSYRRRLLDPDNLCVKYFVDCLRYASVVRNDRAKDIELEVRQERVRSRRNERTEIMIEPLL